MYIHFVGCCQATRGVRGLLWAKGWVWLTESWPVGLLGNSQQNYAAHAAYNTCVYNLVVQLARFFYLYIVYIYMYVCLVGDRAGAYRTYVHVQKLREMPTRHLYPLAFAIRANQSRGEAVETAKSGRCVYPSAELDIHVV